MIELFDGIIIAFDVPDVLRRNLLKEIHEQIDLYYTHGVTLKISESEPGFQVTISIDRYWWTDDYEELLRCIQEKREYTGLQKHVQSFNREDLIKLATFIKERSNCREVCIDEQNPSELSDREAIHIRI